MEGVRCTCQGPRGRLFLLLGKGGGPFRTVVVSFAPSPSSPPASVLVGDDLARRRAVTTPDGSVFLGTRPSGSLSVCRQSQSTFFGLRRMTNCLDLSDDAFMSSCLVSCKSHPLTMNSIHYGFFIKAHVVAHSALRNSICATPSRSCLLLRTSCLPCRELQHQHRPSC